MEIDASKDVYLFVHGRSDLVEKSTAALVAKGFSQEKIIQSLPQKINTVGSRSFVTSFQLAGVSGVI